MDLMFASQSPFLPVSPVPDIVCQTQTFSRPLIPTSSSLSLKELQETGLFKLRVASELEEFKHEPGGRSREARYTSHYIHKELLSSLSRELENHVNNGMREGAEQTMTLEDCDRPTVERFIEWAYTGLYSTPGELYFPELTSEVESFGERDAFFDMFGDVSPELPESVKQKINRGVKIYKKVPRNVKLDSKNGWSEQELREPDPLPPHTSSDTSIHSELQSHAKLFVFGDRFNISRLQQLALCMIEGILKGASKGSYCGFSERFLTDFIELIAYSTNNLPENTLKEPWVERPRVLPMKHLLAYLVRFIAWMWTPLHQQDTFMNFFLYESDPQFRKEVFSTLTPLYTADLKRDQHERYMRPFVRWCNTCEKGVYPLLRCAYCNTLDLDIAIEDYSLQEPVLERVRERIVFTHENGQAFTWHKCKNRHIFLEPLWMRVEEDQLECICGKDTLEKLDHEEMGRRYLNRDLRHAALGLDSS